MPECERIASRRLVVLATGGTIAGLAPDAGDHTHYQAGQVGVAQLLQAVPAAAWGGCTPQGEQIAQIDSKDMGWPVWQALLQRLAQCLAEPDVQGVLITHGTDTLEETAWLLHTLLQPHKPVVLTCAMRPANAAHPDGPQNLADALVLLQDRAARGVLVVCAGEVYAGARVTKRHTYRLDAFDAGEAGPLARIEAGRVRWLGAALAADEPPRPSLLADILARRGAWPRVELVTSHAGADGRVVDLLVQDGVQGLVVAGTGNGTLHADLQAALLRAQAAGVRVWRSTRCSQGAVWPHADDLLPAAPTGLNPVQARLALVLALLQPAPESTTPR